MRLFLGVDGGQSSTKAVIGDETRRILGRGTGGPCNPAVAGGVRESLEAACADAGLDAATAGFEAACFGMSGGPEDKRAILAAILRARRLIVTTDAVIALAGATSAGQGIAVIAGTGSIAFGRNAEGRVARAGGWGYAFGDEGGGFDVVRQAVRAALRMEEGWGPPTSLRATLLGATGARDANDMLHRFYGDGWPRAKVAALAPLVDAAALEGDGVAVEILSRAAHELALLAAAVRGQLWKPGEAIEVAYIGGVFQSRIVVERFRLLVELADGDRCGPPLRSPAEGALMEAYRAGLL
jgi:N-acetylglucosamine kinase-like BadF-type ATPase